MRNKSRSKQLGLGVFKIPALVCTMLVPLLFSSCKDEQPITVGSAQEITQTTVETKEGFNKVDILTPETTVDENSTYENEEIFDLFDLFFKTFVSVINEGPLDTRVNFKSLHLLRKERDQDFLFLVSSIERKMAAMDLEKLDRNTLAAFYINTYNFAAIRLANKGYINDKNEIIDSLLELSKGSPSPHEVLSRQAIPLKTGITSLDEIEKVRLKDIFREDSQGEEKIDARFYFALNTVAMSRAIILNSAYRPETLESQLDFAVKNSLKLERIAKLDGDTLTLSRFMKWFKKDFEKDRGSLEDFLAAFGIDRNNYKKIRYNDFSYTLNDVARYPGIVIKPEEAKLPEFETDPKIDGGEIIPVEPCSFLESDKVTVLSYCTTVVSGQVNGFYKYPNDVIDGSLCVYRRELDDGSRSIGVIGDIVEVKEGSSAKENTTIAVESTYKLKDEKDDRIRTKVTEGVRTTIEYLITDKRLEMRQTSVFPGKGYRKFLMQCQ